LLLLKKSPQHFTLADMENALERVALGGALLENQMLAGELALAHERIDHDAQQLGQLQLALLPPSLPPIAGLEIATSYQPSGRVGGDLYDFFPLESLRDVTEMSGDAGRWCMLIGDASGHGLAAALVMAIVQAVLHAHPPRMDSPASLLTHANRHLCDKRIGGFFTAFVGVYEPSARRLTFANAGHPAPLVRRASDGSLRSLDAALGYPLGIDDDASFQEAIVQLEPGDTILLYTDGITEARNRQQDQFERVSVTRILREPTSRPVDVVEQIRVAVQKHEQGRTALDDQTLVAARVL
jgi:sigma-B regulation protein RsbU (phosphoserine phosphatase)